MCIRDRNQLNTCYNYDAAGNLWQNGAYTYDAENRLTVLSSPVWYYVYDGDGNRVEKCTSSTCPVSYTHLGQPCLFVRLP